MDLTYRDLSVVAPAAISSLVVIFRVLVLLIVRHELVVLFPSGQLRTSDVEPVLAAAPAVDFPSLKPHRLWPHKAVFPLLKELVLFPARKSADGMLLLTDDLTVQVVAVDVMELLLVMLGSIQRMLVA